MPYSKANDINIFITHKVESKIKRDKHFQKEIEVLKEQLVILNNEGLLTPLMEAGQDDRLVHVGSPLGMLGIGVIFFPEVSCRRKSRSLGVMSERVDHLVLTFLSLGLKNALGQIRYRQKPGPKGPQKENGNLQNYV